MDAATTGARIAEAIWVSFGMGIVGLIVLWLTGKDGPDDPTRWSRFMSRFRMPPSTSAPAPIASDSSVAQQQPNTANAIATQQTASSDTVAVAPEISAFADVLIAPATEVAIVMATLVRVHLSVRRDDGTPKIGQTDLLRGAFGIAPGSTSARWRAARAAWDAEIARQAAPALSKFPPLTPEQAAFREEAGLPQR